MAKVKKDTKVNLKEKPDMHLRLTMTEATNTTIGDVRKICWGIEKAGYQVEILPTEITPRAIDVKR